MVFFFLFIYNNGSLTPIKKLLPACLASQKGVNWREKPQQSIHKNKRDTPQKWRNCDREAYRSDAAIITRLINNAFIQNLFKKCLTSTKNKDQI